MDPSLVHKKRLSKAIPSFRIPSGAQAPMAPTGRRPHSEIRIPIPPSSTICPPPSVLCFLSSALCLPSSIFCPLPSVFRLLSSVLCPLFSVFCFLSSAICPLTSVICSVCCGLSRPEHRPDLIRVIILFIIYEQGGSNFEIRTTAFYTFDKN